MFTLEPKKYFIKKSKKMVKKSPDLRKKFITTLEKLAVDPQNPALYSPKVQSRRFGPKWSSKVTEDLRIIWDYSNKRINVLDILDVGGHGGKKGVY